MRDGLADLGVGKISETDQLRSSLVFERPDFISKYAECGFTYFEQRRTTSKDPSSQPHTTARTMTEIQPQLPEGLAPVAKKNKKNKQKVLAQCGKTVLCIPDGNGTLEPLTAKAVVAALGLR